MGELDRMSQSTHYNGIRLTDGSLGGQTGTKAMQNMGVDSISISGTRGANGAASFTISQGENGQTSMSMQLNGQTITNNLNASDTSTTFALKDGTQVKVDFTKTAADLQGGMVNNVGVRSGSSTTDTSKAISSNKDTKLSLQIGANGSQDQRISFGIGDMSTLGLGINGLNISSLDNANAAISAIDRAVNYTSGQRSTLGATQNRLESTIRSLNISQDNLIQAESTIRDADIAFEMMRFMQSSIMQQASQAMFSQGMNLSHSTMLGILMR